MTLRYHWLCRLGMLGCVGLVAAGCATMDPPALTALNQANDAIGASKKAGAAERFPEEFAALETRYLEARGVFYACRESQAADLARAVMDDAKGLGAKRAMAPKAAPMPPPPPPNQPPVARLSAPGTGDVNHLLRFQGDASSDPDGDKLSYMWDFGDGMSARFSFPTSTHRYARVGNYTVRLTVDDGRGGTDSTSTLVQISQRLIIISDVLFDTNKATLKPGASEILGNVVRQLQAEPSFQLALVGHTDSQGAAAYNLRLSEQRASAVRNFLVTNGIAAHRISINWKGETEPVASNDTNAGRAQNRRTEITLKPPAM